MAWGEAKVQGTSKASLQGRVHRKECWSDPQRERGGICCHVTGGEGQAGHVASGNQMGESRTRVARDWAPRGAVEGGHEVEGHGDPSLLGCGEGVAWVPPGLHDD